MISVDKKLIIEALTELSDKNRQKEVWLSEGTELTSSFVEAVETLFTDSGLSDALQNDASVYPPGIMAALKELSDALSAFDSKTHPLEIIDDPEFSEIRTSCKKILQLISST
jgi:predicted lipoprotein